MLRKNSGFLLLILFFQLLFCACSEYKNIPYFQNIPADSVKISVKTIPYKDLRIQIKDLLSISVITLDNNSTSLLNSGNSAQSPQGYLVNNEGQVDIPFLGRFKLEGLTTEEAKAIIQTEAEKHFKTPTVTVRFASFKITVLGAVTSPGTFISQAEKVNVLDAIGLAGDLTSYALRDHIYVIRDSLNNKLFVRMDIRSKEIVSSPYFFLQPNDVVYVKPSKSFVARDESYMKRVNIQIVSSLLSIALVIIAFVTN